MDDKEDFSEGDGEEQLEDFEEEMDKLNPNTKNMRREI